MTRGRKVRVAYGRIGQETNAFSPIQTTMDDFRRTHLLDGAALEAACRPRGVEAQGFTRNAELSGFVKAARKRRGRVETVPLFSAWTVPGGPLSADTLADLRERLDDALTAAGPIDGLFLSLHGAMRAAGTTEDPEALLLADVRRASVLHGKGTGALRDAIRSYLSSCTFVKGVGPAPPREGGDGVTVFELEGD